MKSPGVPPTSTSPDPPADGLTGLRIVNVCRVLWNGGVQRAAIAQTETLRARGRSCDLLFLRSVPNIAYDLPTGTTVLASGSGDDDRPPLAEISRGITYRFARHRGQDASVDLDLLWRARGLVGQYDVAIYNDQYASLLGLLGRLTRGRPYVMMFHEFYPKVASGPVARILGAFADLLDRLALLGAPAIVTTSSQVQARVDRFAPGRSYLARLAAPSAPTPLDPARRDRHSVFSITVWDRGRRPEVFLELARSLPQFRFVLAGIWADPTHLEEFRSAAARWPNLTVTGPISEADRERLQLESLVYLRPGYAESGPGMGGLEALAAGSIVIANRGLGLSECLEHGQNGFVLDDAEPGSIMRLLREIDGLDAARLRELSQRAHALASELSWQAHTIQLERALAHALGTVGRASEPGLRDYRRGGRGSPGKYGTP